MDVTTAPLAGRRRVVFLFGCSLSLSLAGVVPRQCRLSASVFFRFFYFVFLKSAPLFCLAETPNLLLYPIPCRRADGFRDRAAGFLARFGCSGETPTP